MAAYLAIGVELGNIMEALHDKCIRVDEELARFNEEHSRRDLVLDTLCRTLETLQCALSGLVGWEHALWGVQMVMFFLKPISCSLLLCRMPMPNTMTLSLKSK